MCALISPVKEMIQWADMQQKLASNTNEDLVSQVLTKSTLRRGVDNIRKNEAALKMSASL